MTRRTTGALLTLVATLSVGVGTAEAATPDSGSLTAPAPGAAPVGTTWTGTAPAGSNPTSSCPVAATRDSFALAYTPSSGSTTVSFSVTWTPVAAEDTSDLVLEVVDAAGTVLGSSDTSATTETVSLDNLTAGTYTANVCGYVNAQPQPYAGKVTAISAAANAGPPKPVFSTTDPAPGPVVPEFALPVALPLVGAGIVGAVVLRRRRRAL